MQMINCLSTTDKRRFRQFVASPYFNEKEELVQLLDTILNLSDFKNGKMIEEVAFFRIDSLPDRVNPKSISKWFNGLVVLLNKFIAQEEYSRSLLRSAADEIRGKGNRRLYAGFKSRIDKLLKDVREARWLGPEELYQAYRLELEETIWLIRHPQKKRDAMFIMANQYWEDTFLIGKMAMLCAGRNDEGVKGSTQTFDQESLVMQWVQERIQNIPHPPQLMIMFWAIRKMQNDWENHEGFLRALDQFFTYRTSLNEAESQNWQFPSDQDGSFRFIQQWRIARTIYHYLINFCNYHISLGDPVYPLICKRLIRLYIEDIVKERVEHLDERVFLNIVKVLLPDGGQEETMDFVRFIEGAPESLEGLDKLALPLGRLMVKVADGDHSLDTKRGLASIIGKYKANRGTVSNYKYYGHELVARSFWIRLHLDEMMLAKLSFEEFAFAERQLLNFERFLKSNDLIPKRIEVPYHRFCNVVLRLLRIIAPGDIPAHRRSKHIADTKIRIEAPEPLSQRKWLREFIEQIEP